MELPQPLRRAVDRALDGVALGDLAATAAALSQRYREERRDGRPHVATQRDALAYLATRLPATYAAARASLGVVAGAHPDFAPKTVLDIGAGPGTALWAAADCWPGLTDALLIEASPVFRACGEDLAANTNLPRTTWRTADICRVIPDDAPRDLVILAYVLNELAPDDRPSVWARAWQATAGVLVIVEPGTPAGWQRILAARRQLIESGAHVIAPCPHVNACPLRPPDWCHFAERVARSRLHRRAKGAEVPWEDEKFSYVAVARQPASDPRARVIAPPRKASGRVTLKLCRPDGSAGERLFSRRDGAVYKRASRSVWGGSL
ncbi:MAG TPA: small ribosomal subunit Rsm22 family protein [Xanthobacteraceae bacterium]|nr:small ribosomal subunit Rsm22 family protein [Xanthobacteraceae bacterium]